MNEQEKALCARIAKVLKASKEGYGYPSASTCELRQYRRDALEAMLAFVSGQITDEGLLNWTLAKEVRK